jgi:hypothetical protein
MRIILLEAFIKIWMAFFTGLLSYIAFLLGLILLAK